MEPWVRPLVQAYAAGRGPGLDDLVRALGQAGPATRWAALAGFEPELPYGRTVVFAAGGIEVMVAGWSRGRPCAPHDHGSGIGAVQIVEGRARHRVFGLRAGRLIAEPPEVLEPEGLVRCPQGLIHQMEDAGAEQPLVTLHVYAGCARPMAVYDLARARTQWLDPDCGAWLRPVGDAKVLECSDGFMRR